jgi:hypothetical protein
MYEKLYRSLSSEHVLNDVYNRHCGNRRLTLWMYTIFVTVMFE